MTNLESTEGTERIVREIVDSIPDVPPSPGFTDRVMDSVQSESSRPVVETPPRWPLTQDALDAGSHGKYSETLRKARRAAGLPDSEWSITEEELKEAQARHGLPSPDHLIDRGLERRIDS